MVRLVPGEPLLSPLLVVRAVLPFRWPVLTHLSAGWKRETTLFSLGREALAAAAAALPPGRVLAPAYICAEAVERLAATGREVAFYPLDASLDPDWSRLPQGLLKPRAAALLLVHFFGMPADAARARTWCDEKGVSLIEDCAHSYLSSHAGGLPAGSHGDFAFYSFRKQLPVASGAALTGRTLEGVAAARGGGTGLLQAAREVGTWAVFNSRSRWLARRLAPAFSDEGPLIATTAVTPCGMDVASRRIIGSVAGASESIAARRRRNYKLLSKGLSDLPGLAPMFAHLPDGAVPWCLPLRVESGAVSREDLLETLLSEGIGAWAWPTLPAGVTEQGFPGEWRLASETLALPVHQDLRDRHMRHVADTVAAWSVSR